MKKAFGIILVVLALFLGYLGVTQVQESTSAVKVLGIELRAEDKGSKEAGFIQIGLGVVALIGGIYLLGKKEN